MDKSNLKIDSRIWLTDKNGEGILGKGKIQLLEAINETGSLSAAARKLEISYRKAWGGLKKAEELLGFELTVKIRGGEKGGKSDLTPEAKVLLSEYAQFRQKAKHHIEEEFQVFLQNLNF